MRLSWAALGLGLLACATAQGASAHSGSAPDRGRNALLALATAAPLPPYAAICRPLT